MRNYLDLLQKVIKEGVREPNRTGIDTFTISGEMLQFDLQQGFPAVTTKKLFYDTGVLGELFGFLEGATSLKRFQALGCKVWNKNMRPDAPWNSSPHNPIQDGDYMGHIYGDQWRNYRGSDSNGNPVAVDQIAVALADIRSANPSRRIVVNAWNPAELNQAVLPPCHLMFQLLPHKSTGKLHMCMYQRSCDMFLGIPFNIASYATLLHLFAAWGGYEVGTLTMMLADVHIYENHMEQCELQLSREPMDLPGLFINFPKNPELLTLEENLAALEPADIALFGYKHHPAIKADMAD